MYLDMNVYLPFYIKRRHVCLLTNTDDLKHLRKRDAQITKAKARNKQSKRPLGLGNAISSWFGLLLSSQPVTAAGPAPPRPVLAAPPPMTTMALRDMHCDITRRFTVEIHFI